ncbi:MAG: cytochrome b [Mariprofundaceae bacterium]
MILKNTRDRYGLISIITHWLMAIVVFGMFGLGLWMVELNYYDNWYHDAPYIHKSIGMLLLFMLVFRLVWRLINIRPELMGESWEKVVALSVHRSHYVLLFIMMISGYLIPTAAGVGIDVFGWGTVPASLSFDKKTTDLMGVIHLYVAWAVMGLAAAHAGAALKHHLIDKDQTLLRMLGWVKTK